MNIYDIAREAGVSISTVSRVLNNAKCSPKTKDKVQAVLEKYNYQPNEIARGLVKNTMRTIAVMIVDIRMNHYANTAYIMEQVFRENGYHVILCNTGGLMENNRKYIASVLQKKIDGIVFVGSVFNEIAKEPDIMQMLNDIPIVLANGALPLKNAYSVSVNDQWGIQLAVDHLYEKGHRNILYVNDMDTYSAKEKQKGFVHAMAEHELETKNNIFRCEFGLKGGERVAEQILSSGMFFSAVVFDEDLTALGAMKTFHRHGLRIPEDVAITGYDNLEYSLVGEIELTSVDNKFNMLAGIGARLLIDVINGQNAASVKIQPTLVERQST